MATQITPNVHIPQRFDFGLDPKISSQYPITFNEKNPLSADVISTDNQVIPGDESDVEASGGGVLALMMLRIMAGQSIADLMPQLLSPENLTEQDKRDLLHLYTVMSPAPEVDTAHNHKLFDQEQPVNRIKFDPTAISDVAVLLNAYAALMLARIVAAEMTGKFALMAFHAAIEQKETKWEEGRKEFAAAATAAVAGIFVAGVAAKIGFNAQNDRFKNIERNQVEVHRLKQKLEHDQSIIDRRAPNRAFGEGVNPNGGATRSRPDADLSVADSTVANNRPPRNGQADIDKAQAEVNVQQAKAKQAETKLTETQQKFEEHQLELDRANVKVRDAELAHRQNPTADSQTAVSDAKAELKDVTARHEQASADVTATQNDLRDAAFQHDKAKLEAAKVDVKYRTEDVSAAELKVKSAQKEMDALQKDIGKNDADIASLEGRRGTSNRLNQARTKQEALAQKRTEVEARLDEAQAELHQAKLDLIDANNTLATANFALSGHMLAASRELGGADPFAEGSLHLTPEERAILMEDARHIRARINELQDKFDLNMPGIDKQLITSQLLMTVANLLSAMMLGMMRMGAFLEQGNGIMRNAEAGIYNSMTQAQQQALTELTAQLKQVADAIDQMQQAEKNFLDQIASVRT